MSCTGPQQLALAQQLTGSFLMNIITQIFFLVPSSKCIQVVMLFSTRMHLQCKTQGNLFQVKMFNASVVRVIHAGKKQFKCCSFLIIINLPKVSVKICARTRTGSISEFSVLAPETISLMRVLISVRVYNRQEVPKSNNQ